jgi:DNA replication initiation complex subunit (GINS family)
MDAIVLLGLGYMTSRARRWLASDVLPGDIMEQPARKMIAGEMELLDLIVEQIREFNKPILPVIDVVGFDDLDKGNIVKHLDAKGIMAYSSPEQAIRALAKAQNYYQKRRAREQY